MNKQQIEEFRDLLKNDKVTQGIKMSDAAIEHINHLMNLWFLFKNESTKTLQIAIRFYAMGYITGKLEN